MSEPQEHKEGVPVLDFIGDDRFTYDKKQLDGFVTVGQRISVFAGEKNAAGMSRFIDLYVKRVALGKTGAQRQKAITHARQNLDLAARLTDELSILKTSGLGGYDDPMLLHAEAYKRVQLSDFAGPVTQFYRFVLKNQS